MTTTEHDPARAGFTDSDRGEKISTDAMRFPFSDCVAGVVTRFDPERDLFVLRTCDGREFPTLLTGTTAAEVVRNFGEDYHDVSGRIRELLVPGRFLFAHGVFYPEGDGFAFESKHLVLLGERVDEFVFEHPGYWPRHLAALADFYLASEFGGADDIDFARYRTALDLSGAKVDGRQETATMSRLIYGFATAYHMTGEERFLTAARQGCAYMREHLRSRLEDGTGYYWVHAIELGDQPAKLLASEFGDDLGSIPLYEQIYALAGPAQTYRITGDPEIREMIDATVEFMDRYYRDDEGGGYFSHIDPVTFDPRSDSLGPNRARKNWNSIGDHAPAYLINAWLATGDDRFREMLVRTADTIVERLPDEQSPFVNERFHEDWRIDHQWGWQQNRAVVGHNLKIAWNLTRIDALAPHDGYRDLARRLARSMPEVGLDLQRGGWYDVMERRRDEGARYHRLAWHDRKAWWQQEQAILAYLIVAGATGDDEFRRLARESLAFYVAWFPDHDSGGVYFNVLADGLPYLVSGERVKGSHAMAGYHAFELAFLSDVYLCWILRRPIELFFRPRPADLPDGVLRVAPDLIAHQAFRIGEVWVDDQPHRDFDAGELTVRLAGDEPVRVRVRLLTAEGGDEVQLNGAAEGLLEVTARGDLSSEDPQPFIDELNRGLESAPRRLVIRAGELSGISEAAARAILLALQKCDTLREISVTDAPEPVRSVFHLVDPSEEGIRLVDGVEPEHAGPDGGGPDDGAPDDSGTGDGGTGDHERDGGGKAGEAASD